MRKSGFLTVGVLAIFLAGCAANSPWGSKQTGGTAIGAIVGGLAGSGLGGGRGRMLLTIAGVLAGAWVGNTVGASLDRTDLLLAERAAEKALNAPVGKQIAWENPKTRSYGDSTTTRVGKTATGAYCREVHSHAFFFGPQTSTKNQPVDVVTTACQQSDGTWRLVAN